MDTASAQERDLVVESISRLVRDMEEMGHILIRSHRKFEDIMTTKQILNLPSAGGHLKRSIAAQFALGENYWSQVHFDNDAFLCLLSVLPGKSRDDTRIMYYFCFPQYKVAVPLRAGDILIFNPLRLHSCTNCSVTDGFICSAYVSNKTVMTAGIGHLSLTKH